MGSSSWLVKSEPYKYSFSQLIKDRRTVWDGVRNYEARNALRGMKKGEIVLFYHSNEGKEIVGVAKVLREAYQDPTADDDTWSAVELGPVAPLKESVSLDAIHDEPSLAGMALLKRSRLSVTPVTADELATILRLGKTKLGPQNEKAPAAEAEPKPKRAPAKVAKAPAKKAAPVAKAAPASPKTKAKKKA